MPMGYFHRDTPVGRNINTGKGLLIVLDLIAGSCTHWRVRTESPRYIHWTGGIYRDVQPCGWGIFTGVHPLDETMGTGEGLLIVLELITGGSTHWRVRNHPGTFIGREVITGGYNYGTGCNQ